MIGKKTIAHLKRPRRQDPWHVRALHLAAKSTAAAQSRWGVAEKVTKPGKNRFIAPQLHRSALRNLRVCAPLRQGLIAMPSPDMPISYFPCADFLARIEPKRQFRCLLA
jgi:hypothetical protein